MYKSEEIAFISLNPIPWAGSEALWNLGARELARRGCDISACLTCAPCSHAAISGLRDAGVSVSFGGPWPRGSLDRLSRYLPIRSLQWSPRRAFARALGRSRPDLVVFSLGSILDELVWIDLCRERGIPYAILVQQASEVDAPGDEVFDLTCRVFLEASEVYFVSEHNRRVVQTQLGVHLPSAVVVGNPLLIERDRDLPWPDRAGGAFRLACPARLVLRDKGQDLLLDVLAGAKWRERPLEVLLFGEGRHSRSLRAAAEYLALERVRFPGHAEGADAIWESCHGLVLPSRVEGMPLALIEAMWRRRLPIVTDAGGSAELVEDGVSGFVAEAASVSALDRAMDRAWEARGEWEAIGERAGRRIRETIARDPVVAFAELVLDLFRRVGRGGSIAAGEGSAGFGKGVRRKV